MGLTWTSAPGRAVRESGTATGGCTSPGGVMATFIAGCMGIGVCVFLGFALVFSLGPVHRAYLRSRRAIEGVMAAFFAFAGFKLLTARL